MHNVEETDLAIPPRPAMSRRSTLHVCTQKEDDHLGELNTDRIRYQLPLAALSNHMRSEFKHSCSRACLAFGRLRRFGMSERPLLRDRPKIILFGDSITQWSFDVGGWGSRIAHWYARKADIVCRGLSGYNSVWAKLALDKVPSNGYSSSNCFAT